MFMEKPEGKRLLGRRKRVSERMKINLIIKEMGYEGVDWIQLTQTRVQWRDLVNTVMNLLMP
jgi:hypothetical protein